MVKENLTLGFILAQILKFHGCAGRRAGGRGA